MADRISDLPAEEQQDWPDIEDDLIPKQSMIPEGGPYTRSFEFLHGARVTLDADLLAATRLLTAAAATSVLRIAEEQGDELGAERAGRFEAIADGGVPPEQDPLLEALSDLTAFVERHLDPGT